MAKVEAIGQALIKSDDGVIFIGDGGFLAGTITPFVYGFNYCATELAWWIEEDKRGNGIGKELIEAFEQWAKEKGCSMVTMVSIDDSVGKFYESTGYRLKERVYVKDL